MNNNLDSCNVSSLAKSNHETLPIKLETKNETTMQPNDLVVLSKRILERNQCNKSCNLEATNKLHLKKMNRLVLIQLALVAWLKMLRVATRQLKNLID